MFFIKYSSQYNEVLALTELRPRCIGGEFETILAALKSYMGLIPLLHRFS